MSTIKADTLVASDGTSPATLTGQSAAKAWMNLNGSATIGLRDSVNTSSVSDRGTGLYTQSFTSNMANSNYAGSGSAQDTDGDDDGRNRLQVTNAANTSSAYVNTFDTGGSADDVAYVTSIIHGDLA